MKEKLLLLFLFLIPASAGAEQTLEQKILEKITKKDAICSSCRFIVQKKTSTWIKKHDLYAVTTFDILPPPEWNLAVNDKKTIYALDRRNLDDWNQVILAENLSLDKDAKIIEYAKFFLSTTMNQSEFIDKLLESEIKRIEEKEKKKIDAETKIVRSADKIQIVFYANDTQGDLQQWNMVLKNDGEIVKLQQRSF
jgi:hypothetical protein